MTKIKSQDASKPGQAFKGKGFKFPTFDMGRKFDQITLDFEKPAAHEVVHAPVLSARQVARDAFAAKVAQVPRSPEELERAADALLEMADKQANTAVPVALSMPEAKEAEPATRRGKEEKDFANDVPQDEVITEGIDHFQMRGRYMMFVQMLSLVALDLSNPPQQGEHNPEYESAKEFVNDPYGFKHWLFLIGADHRLGPKIAEAVALRPVEIHKACMDVARGQQAETNSFEKFMRMMGVAENGGRSSSYIDGGEVDIDDNVYRP